MATCYSELPVKSQSEPCFDSFSEGHKRGQAILPPGGEYSSVCVWGESIVENVVPFLETVNWSSLTEEVCNVPSLPDQVEWTIVMGQRQFHS